MLNDDELQARLAACPAPRVIKDHIEQRIASTQFTRLSETVTVCSITLDNGYSVRGESACVDPKNYDAAIGERIAHDDAFRKLWPLFGFLLAEYKFLNAIPCQKQAQGSYSASNLSVLAYANNFTLWHYTTTDRAVTGAGYFNAAADMLRVNDLLIVNSDTDGTPSTNFYVVASNNEKSVTVKPFNS